MRGRLFCPVGDTRVDQEFESEATLGRSPQSTVVLGSDFLSSHHARISWDEQGGHFSLEDLGSSNGTRLDGERVVEPRPLGHLHVITLAERFDFIFQDLARCSARHGGKGRSNSLAEGDLRRSTGRQTDDRRGDGARRREGDQRDGFRRGDDRRSNDRRDGERRDAIDAIDRAVSEESSTFRTSLEVLNLPLPSLLRGGSSTPASEKTLLQKLDLPLPSFFKAKIPETPSTDGAATDDRGPAATASARDQDSRPPAPGPHQRPTRPLPGVGSGSQAKGAARAEEIPPKPVPPKVKEARWSLEVPGMAGPERFYLTEEENVVGRSAGAAVIIRSPEVSRRHATLIVRDGRLFIRDLGSRNGTYIDDERITGERELSPGRRLRFGALDARVVVGGFSDAARSLGGETS